MDLQNVFLTVWNMSLTASIIIGFVLLIRLFLRKCPKVFSYALWSVVLFRLLCPVSIPSMFSVLNFTKAAEAAPQSIVTRLDYTSAQLPEFIPVPESDTEIEESESYVPYLEEPQSESPFPLNHMDTAENTDMAKPQAAPRLDMGMAQTRTPQSAPAPTPMPRRTVGGTTPKLETPRTPTATVKEQSIKIPDFFKK